MNAPKLRDITKDSFPCTIFATVSVSLLCRRYDKENSRWERQKRDSNYPILPILLIGGRFNPTFAKMDLNQSDLSALQRVAVKLQWKYSELTVLWFGLQWFTVIHNTVLHCTGLQVKSCNYCKGLNMIHFTVE